MIEPNRLTVVIKPSSTNGAYGICLHCLKPKCRNGVTETGLADRLVEFEVFGAAFCGMAMPPRTPKLISRLIDGGYQGGQRSRFTYRQVVLSVADSPEDRHPEVLVHLYGGVHDFVNHYLKDSPAVAVFYHADKAHLHAHIVATNWDSRRNRLLDWKRRDIIGMNRMLWYKGDALRPGAGLYKRLPIERRPRVYTKADTDLSRLIGEIKKAPKWKESVPYRLAQLEAEGQIRPYQTASGNAGYLFNGRKITLAKINYELRQTDSVCIGTDGMQYDAPSERREDIEQQTFFDAQVGARTLKEYESYQDSPSFQLSLQEEKSIWRGIMPRNKRFQRTARTMIIRKTAYRDTNEVAIALSPLLVLLESLMDGGYRPTTPPAKGSLLGFIFEVINHANGHSNLSALLQPVRPLLELCSDLYPASKLTKEDPIAI